jgi:hypothetical protein
MCILCGLANLTRIESAREVSKCLSSWVGWDGLPDGVLEEHFLHPIGLAYLTGSYRNIFSVQSGLAYLTGSERNIFSV